MCSKGGNLMESFAVEGERKRGRETGEDLPICKTAMRFLREALSSYTKATFRHIVSAKLPCASSRKLN